MQHIIWARHMLIISLFISALTVMTAYAEEFTVEVSGTNDSAASSISLLPESSTFMVEIVKAEKTTPAHAGKHVLIYHTHTYEAYEQSASVRYVQTEKWRTTDTDYNVVKVGRALVASLEALGIEVTHDTTAFEPPTLENAYERSLTMLESRLQNGEQYDLYIDLHRDALASTSNIKRTVNIGGENVARFMVLIGKGTSGGYTEAPNWEANLAIAESITDSLNRQCSNLARDVKIKSGRFNQHIAECCVLIECGMNTNTLDEVLAGIPYLAQAIAESLAEYTPMIK